MPENVVTIAVVLPVFNRRSTTIKCLETLHRFGNQKYRMRYVMVDDGSTDGTEAAVRERFPDVVVISGDGNLWWAGGVNKGFRYIADSLPCDYILLMNDDSDFDQSTLDVLYDYVSSHPRTCASAVALYSDTQTIYRAGYLFRGFLSECIPLYQDKNLSGQVPAVIECDSLSSRFVLMPSDVITTVGFFDARRFPHSYSDIDYFLSARAKGFRNVVLSGSRLYSALNANYLDNIACQLGRKQYLMTLFSHKYANNISYIVHSSLAHRNMLAGFLFLTRRLLSLLRRILLKMVLPHRVYAIVHGKRT